MVIIYTVQNMSIIPIESMAILGCMFCESCFLYVFYVTFMIKSCAVKKYNHQKSVFNCLFHYKLVQFLSKLNVNPPRHKRKTPY